MDLTPRDRIPRPSPSHARPGGKDPALDRVVAVAHACFRPTTQATLGILGAAMIRTILAGAAGVLAAPVVGGLAWRKARQRRVAKALVIDTPNGIVEQRFVNIGGIDQWIQLRGEDRGNPVLLVLHGGPGWPNAVFTLPLRPGGGNSTVAQWTTVGPVRPWAAPARPAAGR